MLENPFTPSEIASLPEHFFGRRGELEAMERCLAKGSVAIQGAVGIGKSSLLARVRLVMEGFGSGHRCHSIVAVANKETRSVDDAARMLLDRFLHCDVTRRMVRLTLPKVVEFESENICSFFNEGRHLAALCRLIEEGHVPEDDLLVLAIDEADKCPVPLARLVRGVQTQVQQCGVRNVRFAVAGVSPFFQDMVDEDGGVGRAFYKTLTLFPLPENEARNLVESKLIEVVRAARKEGMSLTVHPNVIKRIVRLSGGHPHLLQLLGSHLIEHENEDPDGRLDSNDLAQVLRTICYEDRARVYDGLLHLLEVEGKLDALHELLSIASASCPTRIDRPEALQYVDAGVLDWMVTHNILVPVGGNDYCLVDEFLRIRLLLDETLKDESGVGEGLGAERELEERLLSQGRFFSQQDEWELQFRREREAEEG